MATAPSPSSPQSPLSESPPRDDQDASAAASPATMRASNDRDDEPEKPRASMAIPRIPPITPMASQQDPRTLARGLEGCFVDEFGNVLGWDGTVLGRVQGDLPSMVGRPVSAQGHIVDAEGQVAGFVSESFVPPPGASSSPPPPQPSSSRKPLDRGLRVDGDGTIYDHEGVPVGRMTQAQGTLRPGESRRGQAPCACSRSPGAPSPSEVCLDVKSTHDGIQLIIKIPTVFHACPGPPPPPTPL
ncbi:hypothetical protein G6O67_001730 [Ophiocordyceps sinensis]|uniref:LEA domain protein n=1 Tax=Ophiocordyceps sinensis TaxID=72228 RepID=A0A8H4V981_9HYPO|nr:hypothetical protein G6O67_001730 [Ophiocordyceps sinensis]